MRLIIMLLCLAFCHTAISLQRYTLQHDDLEREYFVHQPSQQSEQARPLVIAIHGYSSMATGFEEYHGMASVADRHGFIIAYPQGSHFVDRRDPKASWVVTSWNDLAANTPVTSAGPHCTNEAMPAPRPPECEEFSRCSWTSCNDDLGFLERMLDQLQQDFLVDPRRIYLLGVSNGGMMALTLGCRLPERFAAMASIIAQLAPGHDCGPTTDLPMIHLAGAKDTIVKIDGKPGVDGFIYTSRDQTLKTWALSHSMSCQVGPQRWSSSLSDDLGLDCVSYSDCRVDGQEVVGCVDPQGDHDWPGQRVKYRGATCVTNLQIKSIPDAPLCPASGEVYDDRGMELVWQFFSRYPDT